MKRASITRDRDWLLVRFPYDATVVSAIKSLPTRAWDPDDKCWEVPVEFKDEIERILISTGHRVDILGKSNGDADWVEAVFEAVSSDNAKRLYMGLSKAFHPDAGGDPDIMRRINDAYHGGKV